MFKQNTQYTYLFFLLLLCTVPSLALSTEYAVIVNSDSHVLPNEVMDNLKIKRLFLKEQRDWSSGVRAKPLDRKSDSVEHAVFLKIILDMSEAEFAAHWLTLKQKTGETPPRVVKRTRTLIRVVSKKKGAFAVIKASQAKSLGDAVKVIYEFSD